MRTLRVGCHLNPEAKFRVAADPGTRYAIVCVEDVMHPAFWNEDGSPRYYDGQPIIYLASCDGFHRQVADRIVHLLNTYGIAPDTAPAEIVGFSESD